MDKKRLLYSLLIISVSLILLFISIFVYTPGIDSQPEQKAPEITAIDAPDSALIYENIEVKINIAGESIKEVSLRYESADGMAGTIHMLRENESTYVACIPSQNFTGKVFYYISVEDEYGNVEKTSLYQIEVTPRIDITEAVSMLYSQIIEPVRGENETVMYVYSDFPENESSLPKAKILENNEKISDSAEVLFIADSPVWFFYVPNLFISNSSNTPEACVFIDQHGDISVRPCVSPIKIEDAPLFETFFDGNIPVTVFPIPDGTSYPAKESLENATEDAVTYLKASYGNSTGKALIACENPVIYSTGNATGAYWLLYAPDAGDGFSQGLIWNVDCDTGKTSYSYGITSLELPYGSEYRFYISASLKNPSWNDSVVIFYGLPETEDR